MNKHANPAMLWQLARRQQPPEKPLKAHLESCPDCLTVWEILQAFSRAPETHLDHAPSGWLERAMALARTPGKVRSLLKLMGHLHFDSWTAPSPAVLRGRPGELSRRLRWQFDTWELDLRAESIDQGWACTAQVLADGEAVPGVEIRVTSQHVHTDAAGLVSWMSARPPRTIRVSHPQGVVELGPVSWKRPKKT